MCLEACEGVRCEQNQFVILVPHFYAFTWSSGSLNSAPTVSFIDSMNLLHFLGLIFVICFQHTDSTLEHSSRICKDKAGGVIVPPD